ncbi:MAG TPA: RseA family anti-sigma factor [Luteimonas sp.]|nr:RseA family anti-sigma factor [Luteimonas sp.]HRP72194.1 RseA family anti-sigma factor [Luteimonas sp.]
MSPVDDNEAMQIGPDPDKLFVYHRQQLSAMLDGELSPDQAKFMLRRLQHDGELATCWERWQVCGDVLRGQRNDLLPRDFAQRVALAVAGGGTVSIEVQPAHAARPRLARWGGGAAIAASVALLAVFASRQLPDPGALPGEVAPTPLVAEASAPAPLRVAPVIELQAADAVADAGTPADAGPPATPALPDAATALAAAAVAVAEVPRRTSERRTRAQPQRAASRAQATQEAPASVAVAANDTPPVIGLPADAATAGDHFAMPSPALARPWPRALLPSGNAFTVTSGGLAPREPEFEPFFVPADRAAPWLRPVATEPAQVDASRP